MHASKPALRLPRRIPSALDQGTLLLVDDDPQCARFVAHAAEECGYEAYITISHKGFKERYRDVKADVIILDLAMPGADGVELLRFLANERCTALVIILSGFDKRVVDAAIRLGVVLGLRMGAPLTKPIILEELAEALQGGGVSPVVCSLSREGIGKEGRN